MHFGSYFIVLSVYFSIKEVDLSPEVFLSDPVHLMTTILKKCLVGDKHVKIGDDVINRKTQHRHIQLSTKPFKQQHTTTNLTKKPDASPMDQQQTRWAQTTSTHYISNPTSSQQKRQNSLQHPRHQTYQTTHSFVLTDL